MDRAKKRHCMGCRKAFTSPHAGIRFCNPCRRDLDEVSPLAPDCERPASEIPRIFMDAAPRE